MSEQKSVSYCPHCVLPKTKEALQEQGLYHQLFPDLPAAAINQQRDLDLGVANGPMEAPTDQITDNPRISAGWPFYGQIVAHDVTRDRAPLAKHEDTNVKNFHKPRIDLECLYGDGPVAQPYFYDRDDTDKLLIGFNDTGEPNDLARNPQGVALIPDARNDTYLFISQLHLALQKLHNRLVDEVRAASTDGTNVFAEAQRLTRWHHQWVLVHEYLPLHVGQEVVDTILAEDAAQFRREQAFMPVEFAAGAFRFGHAQVRDHYDVNERVEDVPIFPDLVGQQPVPAERTLDMARVFRLQGRAEPLASKRIDASYSHAMMHLPKALTGELDDPKQSALAYRDLQRSASLGLLSGEVVAERFGLTPLSREQLELPQGLCEDDTPLSYYVQKEAFVQNNGTHLGAVGGRLIAGVLLDLLRGDPTSYLASQPEWQPTLPFEGETFGMADLLKAAGVG